MSALTRSPHAAPVPQLHRRWHGACSPSSLVPVSASGELHTLPSTAPTGSSPRARHCMQKPPELLQAPSDAAHGTRDASAARARLHCAPSAPRLSSCDRLLPSSPARRLRREPRRVRRAADTAAICANQTGCWHWQLAAGLVGARRASLAIERAATLPQTRSRAVFGTRTGVEPGPCQASSRH